ncbi:helix-turn-helix domain-containing protein [Ideonella azotifigens]|uniref:Helix-turn-helix domain-containing protein n=1 Tax=Ideonella azotifigens TaxID=513160 RepID=A0ABN1KAR2_9BURK|nr:helix-turn-helix domain-containing protein [Ideonella azotifigens]MCD2338818.1 helix-turn-helix domain-containing protein [Ideonella azotifigens]
MTSDYSPTVRQLLASPAQRYAHPGATASPAEASAVLRHHFSVAAEARTLQAPAWRDYVGRSLDVPLSRSQVAAGFHGEIATHVLSDMVFMDIRSDAVTQLRSAARIGTDTLDDYVFHVAVEGLIESVAQGHRPRRSTQFMPGVLALDMRQPWRMHRPTQARVLAFMLPRAKVEAVIPDAPAIHGQVVTYTSSLARLLLAQLQTLATTLPRLPPAEAERAIRSGAELMLAAFGRQARLHGHARNAVRMALLDRLQHHVQENLHQDTLSPDGIRLQFRLPRATLYRLFEPEGGLAAYIRNCRLREAAEELLSAPNKPIIDIAYGLSFNSASDFTRAFRRAYGMAPQDFRAMGLPAAKAR